MAYPEAGLQAQRGARFGPGDRIRGNVFPPEQRPCSAVRVGAPRP